MEPGLVDETELSLALAGQSNTRGRQGVVGALPCLHPRVLIP